MATTEEQGWRLERHVQYTRSVPKLPSQTRYQLTPVRGGDKKVKVNPDPTPRGYQVP